MAANNGRRPNLIIRHAVLVTALFAGIFLCYLRGFGLSASDYAVSAWAEVSTNPLSITLKWNADSRATNYIIYRKDAENQWTPLTNLPSTAFSFTDINVEKGIFYEYKIIREGIENNKAFRGISYILSGIEIPPAENRGGLILLVDSSLAQPLTNEIRRLELDLTGDGWNVIRREIQRSASPQEVKSIITNIYYNSSVPVKALFLLGRIPVPYSGTIAPDGHSDHVGAWPADVYYGDVDGAWTDFLANYTNSASQRLTNIPDDGKFDQNQLPSDTELWVGRVDLSNMPAFGLTETELIRKYLWKDHNFRFNIFRFQRKGVIDDNFGEFSGEAFSASAWRDFTAFFGRGNVTAGDYFTTLYAGTYLWSYGCGAGSYTSASGVGSTDQFAAKPVYTVFTMLFGSYHGDWDSQNNFMRAALCYPSYGLVCGWSGRPHWHCHHMAMGFPIGYSAWITQNNSDSQYEDSSYFKRYVHIALMGDPTLRLHTVTPPSSLKSYALSDGAVQLTWERSTDNVVGYIVYGADELTGNYTRLHDGFISGTNFTVNPGLWNYYMVRAVKAETSASGSYYNLSQGIFQSAPSVQPPEPVISIIEPAPNQQYTAAGKIKISADLFDPSRAVSKIVFYNGAFRLGEATSPPYDLTWQNPPAGTYEITAVAEAGTNTYRSLPVGIVIYLPLVEKMSVWKYLDDGSDAGVSWRMPEFDDSNWKSGQAELGYSNAPVTVVNFGDDPENKYITTYFRKTFTVDDPQSITNLVVGLKRDDGAVIYINGIEVFRDNMPAGEINYRTLAVSAVVGDDESKFFVRNISPQILRKGTNLIAVEVHQNSPSSSDLSFDAYIYGEVKTPQLKLSLWLEADGSVKLSYPNLSPLIKIQTKQKSLSDEWTIMSPYIMQSGGFNTFIVLPDADCRFFRLIIE